MEKENRTLKTLLEDWEDYDVAHYYFCCILGLVEYDNSFGIFRENKGVFCTNNQMSTMINEIFVKLTEIGILEENGDGLYRFNQSGKTLQELAYKR